MGSISGDIKVTKGPVPQIDSGTDFDVAKEETPRSDLKENNISEELASEESQIPRHRARTSSAGKITLLWLIFFALIGIFISQNFGPFETLANGQLEDKVSASDSQLSEQSIWRYNYTKNADDYTPAVFENHLSIPMLGTDAPITWQVSNIASEVKSGLEKGLIHLEGTAMPGEKGNIYITGHSSNNDWARGKFNSVFATLDKLNSEDKIYIRYNGQVYTYQVFDQKVVSADDPSLTKQGTDTVLNLVTCWPVGSSDKRLIVMAGQISPDPRNNTAKK